MQPSRLLAALTLGLLVGGLLPGKRSGLQAAPAEVLGSANVAVDVYRNPHGTYVVWANGRITDAKGGSNDLAHPLQEPDSSNKIGKPSYLPDGGYGSGNVTVGTLSRSDGTFLVFSNGALLRPANSQAAAPASDATRLVAGSWGLGSSSGEGYQLQSGGTQVQIRLSEPVSSDSQVLAFGNSAGTARSNPPSNPSGGTTGQLPIPGSGPPSPAAPSPQNLTDGAGRLQPLGFSISGDGSTVTLSAAQADQMESGQFYIVSR